MNDIQETPSENERALAALAHASSVIGFAGLGPLVLYVWSMNKSPFVAYHAQKALVFHTIAFVVVLSLALCTFGLGTLLLIPWFLYDLYLGYLAYQGKWASYLNPHKTQG